MTHSDPASTTSPPEWVRAFQGTIDDVAAVARALGFDRATARNVRFYQNSGIVDPPTDRLGRKGRYEMVRLTQFCAALALRRSGVALERVAEEVEQQGAVSLTDSLWTPNDPRPATPPPTSGTNASPARRQVTDLGNGLELIHPAGMTEAELHRALASYVSRHEPPQPPPHQQNEVSR